MSLFHSYTFKLILFFVVLALSQALQCSDCPAGNSCCMDYLDGARCYNSAQATCASTQQTGSNGLSTYRLCGLNNSACGSVCYDPRGYYCCAGHLKQNSQSCDSTAATPTASHTSTPTQSPTSATTQAPTSAPTTAAPQYNCMAIGGQYGVNCSAGETCCGAQTMSPSCLPANGTKVCCQYYLSATQCTPDQVCGGILGAGASSYALCGPPKSTFCFIGFEINTFCNSSQPVCCGQGTTYAFCCAAGATCNNTGGSCVPAPSTPAPTVTSSVTKSPTTAKPKSTTSSPAAMHNCTSSGIDGTHTMCGNNAEGQPLHCCGNLLKNETAGYSGPSSVTIKCYDPAHYKCCYGGTSPEFDPNFIEPSSYVIPPGYVQSCTA